MIRVDSVQWLATTNRNSHQYSLFLTFLLYKKNFAMSSPFFLAKNYKTEIRKNFLRLFLWMNLQNSKPALNMIIVRSLGMTIGVLLM